MTSTAVADEISVAWLAPETHPEYPLGAYVEVLAEGDQDGRGSPQFGDLVAWVNAAPAHPVHGGGWFERYTSTAGAYRPRRDAEPGDDGYLSLVDAAPDVTASAQANRENLRRVRSELKALLDLPAGELVALVGPANTEADARAHVELLIAQAS